MGINGNNYTVTPPPPPGNGSSEVDNRGKKRGLRVFWNVALKITDSEKNIFFNFSFR